MTSETPIRERQKGGEQAPTEWQPGTNPDVLPTLVVLLSTNGEETKALKEGVEARLRPTAEMGALQWVDWTQIDPESPGSAVAEACEPLLALPLWQRLVEGGYQTHLPDHLHPARVQVIVLWDQIAGSAQDSLDLLTRILEAKELLGARAEISPVLLWLGVPPSPFPDELLGYWPRIRLEPITLGGTTVKPQRLYEVSQHLIVALIATELGRAMEHIRQRAGQEVGWLILGASALVGDPQTARNWLHQVVPKWLLESLVAKPLTDGERHRIEKVVERRVAEFRKAMVKRAVEALEAGEPPEAGKPVRGRWRMALDEEHRAIRKGVLEDQGMREAIFGPCLVGPLARLWGVRLSLRDVPSLISALSKPFGPDEDLEARLKSHYNEVFERVQFWWSADGAQGLAPEVVKQAKDLKEFLGAFLDRGLISPEGQPILSGREPLPVGLEAAIHAVVTMASLLAEEGDFTVQIDGTEEKVPIAALGPDSEKYLQAAARSDAEIIREHRQRYEHLARTLASPLGVALHLLPAWPLATYLLYLLSHWSLERCMLVAGAALLIIGALDLAYWWLIRARRLLGEIQQTLYRLLVRRILGLTAFALRDYRLWTLRWLRESETLLIDLYSVLYKKYREATRAWQSIETVRNRAEGGLYRLVDPSKVSEWAEAAANNVHRSIGLPRPKGEGPYDSAVTAFFAEEFWPLAKRPTPIQFVWHRLEDACTREADQQMEQEFLKASMLAEEVEELREGKRWDWLTKQALPLGRVRPASAPFTIILAPAHYLEGETGKNSRYWQADWMIASTRQDQEEICIRGVIEGR